ncbi:MAG: heavy metal translocating P-type ATPase [Candidatus Hydrothermales bacterium]
MKLNRKKLCENCKNNSKLEEPNEKNNNLKEILIILTSSIVLLITLFLNTKNSLKTLILIISYLILAEPIIKGAIKNFLKGNFFNEHTLMTLATLGAIIIDEIPEAVAVAFLYRIGEFLQNISIKKSKQRIKEILELKPNYANLKKEGSILKVKPEDVKKEDIIVIKPGEKVPLDGIILKGESIVDTSPLTGESTPRLYKKGDEILAGVINKDGLLEIKVTREYKESSISKILNLIEKAKERKANPEKFITKFSKYYTPSVIMSAIAFALGMPLLSDISLNESVYRALVLLVISCPCALVISVPLSYFIALGSCSKNGILVKGSNFLDTISNVNFFVFDKTGTLTEGVFKVKDIVNFNGFSKEEIIELSAFAEYNSNHPIAKAIIDYYGKKIKDVEYEEFQEKSGLGIKAKIKGKSILIGSDRFLHENNISHQICYSEGTTVHVVINNIYAGYFTISDEIRKEVKELINTLKEFGIKTGMLTGDRKVLAESISKNLKLDFFKAELLPHEKAKEIENLRKKYKVSFVGDGINDAAAIATSDVGIAMGAMGQDAAIESSDIVVMDDNLSKIKKLIKISKKTKRIVLTNIILAILIKAIFVYLGFMGIAKMWEAIFADMGVSILAILNSMRIVKS